MLVFRRWTKGSPDLRRRCFTLAWTDSDPFSTLAVDLEFLPRATLDLNASRRGREVRLVCVYLYSHAFACPGAKRVGNISL
jgi:hypothetical protein